MLRAMDKWLPDYLIRKGYRLGQDVVGPRTIYLSFVDHYEPFWGGGDRKQALRRVGEWTDAYMDLFGDLKDSAGGCPKHTFFYPEEEYDADCMVRLADLCRMGAGEVEIHLHHRNDTEEGFRNKLTSFRDRLHQEHGLLGKDDKGRVRYGFIHGNWALCNARPDGDCIRPSSRG